jgi:hypothetical protein
VIVLPSRVHSHEVGSKLALRIKGIRWDLLQEWTNFHRHQMPFKLDRMTADEFGVGDKSTMNLDEGKDAMVTAWRKSWQKDEEVQQWRKVMGESGKIIR